jgi:hypothetical protein
VVLDGERINAGGVCFLYKISKKLSTVCVCKLEAKSVFVAVEGINVLFFFEK